MMIMFVVWSIVAIIIFGILTYSIGRTIDTADPSQEDTVFGSFFVSAVISIFWPVCLALIVIFGPFYLPYKLGVRNRIKALEKEKMWDSLKR